MKATIIAIMAAVALTMAGHTPPPGVVAQPPKDTSFKLYGYKVSQQGDDVRQQTKSYAVNSFRMTLESMARPENGLVHTKFYPIINYTGMEPDRNMFVWIPMVNTRPDGGSIIAWMRFYKMESKDVQLYLANYDSNGTLLDAIDCGKPEHFFYLLEDCPTGFSYEIRNGLRAQVDEGTAGFEVVTTSLLQGNVPRDHYLLNGYLTFTYDIDADGHFANLRITEKQPDSLHYDPLALSIMKAAFAPRHQSGRLDAWNQVAQQALKAPAPTHQQVPADIILVKEWNSHMWDANPDEYVNWLAANKKSVLIELVKEDLKRGAIDVRQARRLVEAQPKKARKRLIKELELPAE